jgi:Winged helix-turn helix
MAAPPPTQSGVVSGALSMLRCVSDAHPLCVRTRSHVPCSSRSGRRRSGICAATTARVLLCSSLSFLEKLKVRLKEPPPDGGIWTSRKVADFMADQLGLETLAQQRGWEALQAIGWSIQSPRPKNPNSAISEEAKAFKKTSLTRSPKKPTSIPTSRSRSGRAGRRKGRGLRKGWDRQSGRSTEVRA